MNWKKFKTAYKDSGQIDESHFILGIDLGNDTSVISYFNASLAQPEVLDISGGYGKPSVPTVMQYIAETKEWVFGEYAVLNVSKHAMLTSLVERLGKKEYVDIENRSVPVTNVLSQYIKELVGNIKNINPKGEIVGIIVSVPSYVSQEAKEELLLAFHNAGYEKELIDLIPDRECIFSRYYFDNQAKEENILLLDFGSRQLRGGLYAATPGDMGVSIKTLSSLFDDNTGTKRVNDAVVKMFKEYYCNQLNIHEDTLNSATMVQLNAFVYQHKDLLFQKNIATKPVRMYFNFAYPPFQRTVTKNEIDSVIAPFHSNMEVFLRQVLEKNVYSEQKPQDVNVVICTGGGFEMLWARKLIENYFPNSRVVFYKNSKTAIAEGATIIAASELNVVKGHNLQIEDRNQLDMDIGVYILSGGKKRFLPIIEKNSFWWQNPSPKIFIIKEETNKPLGIYKREGEGGLNLLEEIMPALPSRPKGTTKLKLEMRFESYHHLAVTIADMGFGELFPKSAYKETFVIEV